MNFRKWSRVRDDVLPFSRLDVQRMVDRCLLPLFFIVIALFATPSADAVCKQNELLIATRNLPSENWMRLAVQAGQVGDGVRRDWMDPMKSSAIQEVIVDVQFEVSESETDVNVIAHHYLRVYSDISSEIKNQKQIMNFRTVGIEALVDHYALIQVRRNLPRMLMSAELDSARGVAHATFLDNECLPVIAPPAEITDPTETPLLKAMNDDDFKTAEDLIKQDRFVDNHNQHGETPLMRAARLRSTGLIRDLLEHRATVNAQDRSGRTALILASWTSDERVVQLLLKYDADPNLQALDGSTALIYACTNQDTLAEIIKSLITAGAQVNVRDGRGRTALMHAAFSGNFYGVTSLLNYGADRTLTDIDGRNAFDYVKERTVGRNENHDKIQGLLSRSPDGTR